MLWLMYDDECFDTCWAVTAKEEEGETLKTALEVPFAQLRDDDFRVFRGMCALTLERRDNSKFPGGW